MDATEIARLKEKIIYVLECQYGFAPTEEKIEIIKSENEGRCVTFIVNEDYTYILIDEICCERI